MIGTRVVKQIAGFRKKAACQAAPHIQIFPNPSASCACESWLPVCRMRWAGSLLHSNAPRHLVFANFALGHEAASRYVRLITKHHQPYVLGPEMHTPER